MVDLNSSVLQEMLAGLSSTSASQKRVGLADFDGRPLQAHTSTDRARGVVAGASVEYPVINIQ